MHLSAKQIKELTRYHSHKNLLAALKSVQTILSHQFGNAETMKALDKICTIDSKVRALAEKLEDMEIK